MGIKTKPLPPLKRLRGGEDDNDSKNDERLEMEELMVTQHDDDEYYFEDPSNIGNYIILCSMMNGE